MNVYEIRSPEQLLAGNPYPGRGIVIGMTLTVRTFLIISIQPGT